MGRRKAFQVHQTKIVTSVICFVFPVPLCPYNSGVVFFNSALVGLSVMLPSLLIHSLYLNKKGNSSCSHTTDRTEEETFLSVNWRQEQDYFKQYAEMTSLVRNRCLWFLFLIFLNVRNKVSSTNVYVVCHWSRYSCHTLLPSQAAFVEFLFLWHFHISFRFFSLTLMSVPSKFFWFCFPHLI